MRLMGVKYPVLILLMLVTTFLGHSYAQTRDRVVGLHREVYVGPPEGVSLVITDISLAGETIRINRPFPASDGWLRELVIRVKNNSGRPISSARVMVRPERGRFEFTLPPSETWAGLKPGAEADLRLSEGKYPRGGDQSGGRADLEKARSDVVTKARWAEVEYAVIRFAGETNERIVRLLRVPGRR